MTIHQTSQLMARVLYFLEILVFAAPFYLTYGLFALVSAPYSAVFILMSPLWLIEYLSHVTVEVMPIIVAATALIFVAILFFAAGIALWMFAKLSFIYLAKGAHGLAEHRRGFRVGFYSGIGPLLLTTALMAAVVVNDGGWSDLPFALLGGSTLMIPIAHLWIAMRNPPGHLTTSL